MFWAALLLELMLFGLMSSLLGRESRFAGLRLEVLWRQEMEKVMGKGRGRVICRRLKRRM